jgi:hypothetical protein
MRTDNVSSRRAAREHVYKHTFKPLKNIVMDFPVVFGIYNETQMALHLKIIVILVIYMYHISFFVSTSIFLFL